MTLCFVGLALPLAFLNRGTVSHKTIGYTGTRPTQS